MKNYGEVSVVRANAPILYVPDLANSGHRGTISCSAFKNESGTTHVRNYNLYNLRDVGICRLNTGLWYGGNSLFPADAVLIACDVRVNYTCEMLLSSSEVE